mmetsp:Transcript_128163/g.347860  ORF Transcript_128163/g.347860 Transcript_128163/m.347860 type:complete len:274 (+) Transcript_128163:138-959(+)
MPIPIASPRAPPTIPFRTAAAKCIGHDTAQRESKRSSSCVTIRSGSDRSISQRARPHSCSVRIQTAYFLGARLCTRVMVVPGFRTPTHPPFCTRSLIIPRAPVTQGESELTCSHVTLIRIRDRGILARTRGSRHSVGEVLAYHLGAGLIARIVVIPSRRYWIRRSKQAAVPLGAGAAECCGRPVARAEPQRRGGVVAFGDGRHALRRLGARGVHEVRGRADAAAAAAASARSPERCVERGDLVLVQAMVDGLHWGPQRKASAHRPAEAVEHGL